MQLCWKLALMMMVLVCQGSSNLDLEIHFPAEFSSNPNQTHLSMLIKVFGIIRESQIIVCKDVMKAKFPAKIKLVGYKQQRVRMQPMQFNLRFIDYLRQTTNIENKLITCCTKVSTSEMTDPIISFRMRENESPPCVKAVIFETEQGYFCSDWRQPWVKRKIQQFLKVKSNKYVVT